MLDKLINKLQESHAKACADAKKHKEEREAALKTGKIAPLNIPGFKPVNIDICKG
jgi:hypothetical protein